MDKHKADIYLRELGHHGIAALGPEIKKIPPSQYKAPETGNPPQRGGTEHCPFREEIPRNETYIEVRCNDEG